VSARDLLDLIWIVPALPLAGSVVLLLFGRRIGEPRAGWLATGLMGLAFVWSVVMFAAMLSLPGDGRANTVTLWTWLPAGRLEVDLGFLADPLSVTWILLVTGVGSLIHLYSIGYMHGDARFSRFFAYLNLFAAAMLVLVLGSSFLVTFLGWEGVGLASYLLISFWFERNRASVAGQKAFVANRVGDFGFMIAMFLIVSALGSLDYAAMSEGADGIAHSTVTAIALLLFLGCVGKSAQIPLHVWLPDAMEGPTPVSALIHAATMVTAGVFLVCRAHPFFEASGDAMTVVAWLGAATAVLAGTVALVQVDIKRVLAYSTVSQLGYMFLACGVGSYSAAVFLVLCHAFYKGTLFLGSGTVIHGSEDNQDIRRMGGYRRYLPLTGLGFVVAWLAIAGVPPFAGFWAKDDVIGDAFYSDHFGIWVVALVGAVTTALYMTRETLLVFFGNERFRVEDGAGETDAVEPGDGAAPEPVRDETTSPTVDYGTPPAPAHLHHGPHEGAPTMVLPVLVLAALAAVGGILNLPFVPLEFLTHWLEPVFEGVSEPHPDSFVEGLSLELLAAAVALAGVVVAYATYREGLARADEDPFDRKLGPLAKLFGHAYYFDEGVSAAVGGPGRRAATWLSDVFDGKLVDGAVDGVARLFRGAGIGLRRVQTGFVRQYALGVVVGVVGLLLYALARSGVG
jgi:NADH-quinone oxidoreductase subunit L